MIRKSIITAGVFVSLLASSVFAADCGPAGKSVRILGSDFPAIHAVAGTAKDHCAANAAEFTVTHKD